MRNLVQGTSRSGVGTTLYVPSHRVAFDMGAPLMEAVKFRKVFVTHGHVDHTTAMVFHASTRNLMGRSPSVFHVPAEDVSNVSDLLDAAGRLNGGKVPYEVVEMCEGESHDFGGSRRVVPFATDHRVPSLGYKLYQVRNKLREEFLGLPGPDLGRLKREEGVELTRPVEVLALAYVGDSRVTVLDTHPEVLKSEVLVLDSTFMGDYPLDKTHERGHTHLAELAERAELFKDVKTLVLTHFSLRYSEEEVKAELALFPDSLRDKVQLVF